MKYDIKIHHASGDGGFFIAAMEEDEEGNPVQATYVFPTFEKLLSFLIELYKPHDRYATGSNDNYNIYLLRGAGRKNMSSEFAKVLEQFEL